VAFNLFVFFCFNTMFIKSGLYRLEEVRNSIVEDGHVAIALKADVVNKSEVFNLFVVAKYVSENGNIVYRKETESLLGLL